MEEYDQSAIDAYVNSSRPVPGQSLVHTPDSPYKWEQPSQLLLEENYMPLMKAIGDGVTITDLALQLGYVGFREGKFNPDLMLMLLEPVMYLLMALAEKAGIEYRIDSDDDDEVESIIVGQGSNISSTIKKDIKEKVNVSPSTLPKDIQEKINKLEMPENSLLAKSENEPMQTTSSLLERGK
jgi:hypothetical protein